jgi:hypothetical protein
MADSGCGRKMNYPRLCRELLCRVKRAVAISVIAGLGEGFIPDQLGAMEQAA